MASPTNAVLDPALVRFARQISHDLNNYVTVVRTYSELLLSDVATDAVVRADLEEIHRAADGMVHYLQRVTRFARAGTMRKVPLPVGDACEEAVESFRTAVPARAVQLLRDAEASIEADPQWFRDVVLELLRNAHEAAPTGSAISVSVAVADDQVIVAVRDEGDGIPDGQLALFEPFTTSKHGVRGAGQGLAMAMAFALALDGSLLCARDGLATVVTLRLPRRTAATDVSAPRS